MINTNETITIDVRHLTGGGFGVIAHIPDHVLQNYGPALLNLVLEKVADKLAAQIIETHGAEMLTKITPEAVSGAVAVQAANQVADAIHTVAKTIKDRPKPVTHVHTTVRNYNSIF